MEAVARGKKAESAAVTEEEAGTAETEPKATTVAETQGVVGAKATEAETRCTEATKGEQ